jgi:putative glutamine amidotransferase
MGDIDAAGGEMSNPGSASPPPPVVGICARTAPVSLWGNAITASLVLQSHVDMLVAAGCIPVLLPLTPGAGTIVGQLHGLLVPGGPDLDPTTFGERPHAMTRGADPDVDVLELALLDAALDAGLPVLAICRGMQLLNVHYGGTLHQHLPEVIGTDSHRPPAGKLGAQRLDLQSGSLLATIFGDDVPEAPCHHHQGLARVGGGLAVTARAVDGVVEAIEVPDHPFAVGVQWEAGQTDDARLHHALAAAARDCAGQAG